MKLTSFGLSEDIVQQLQQTIKRYPVDDAVIYGSRGRGDYKPTSDIDLAIYGQNLSPTEFANLYGELESLPILFHMDIAHVEALHNPALIAHIQRDGQSIIDLD
jgi:predicted nucleotidyltransferase